MENLTRQQKFSIFAFVFMLLALPLLLVAVNVATTLLTGADETITPRNVVFTNITDSSITVTYTTDQDAEGSATATGGGSVQSGVDTRDTGTPGTYRSHHIVIPNLSPSTEYQVTVFSGGDSFDVGSVTTAPLRDTVGTPDTLFGQINGGSISEGIVYAVAGNEGGNTNPVSATISTDGGSATYSIDLNSLVPSGKLSPSDKEANELVIFVEALDAGNAIVQIPFPDESPGRQDIDLSTDDDFQFNPDVTITPGQAPPTDPGEDPPVEPPVDDNPEDFLLDQFSESLLTELYSTGAEQIHPFAPYNVFISNVTPSGFTVNWLTKQPATGYIEVLEGEATSAIVDPRDGSIENRTRRFTHSAEASSGSIPSGTVFEFLIVSEEIVFGRNIDEIAADYNQQYREYAQLYYPEDEIGEGGLEAEPQQQIIPGELQGDEDVPEFEYIPSDGIELEPFRVIVPGAPDQAPLPVAQQGNFELAVPQEKVENNLLTLANKNPSLNRPPIDLNRDQIIAVKTADGTWASSLPTESGGFSISLGSTLVTDKTSYIDVDEGDSLQVEAFGYLGQQFSGSQTYSQTPTTVSLTNPSAFISILHTDTVAEPLIYGYGSGATIDITVNGSQEIVQVGDDGGWQSLTENLKLGLNELTITDSSGSHTVLFIVDLDELPVTALSFNQIMIAAGLVFLAIGIIFYRKYNKK